MFRKPQDALLTKEAYGHGTPFKTDSGGWPVRLGTMFHSSGDAALFETYQQLECDGFQRTDTALLGSDSEDALPLYEGKMFTLYNHRAGSVVLNTAAVTRQRQAEETSLAECCEAAFTVAPFFWVRESNFPPEYQLPWFVCFKKVTASTNVRTLVASLLPHCATNDSIHILFPEPGVSPISLAALYGQLASFSLDYISRQKLGGVNFNFYVLEQLPVLLPSEFDTIAGWNQCGTLQEWLLRRVLELTFTAWDLAAFAADCGYDGSPFRWDEERRFLLRCELDAAYFHLYLGSPAEWGTDSPQLLEMFSTPRDAVEYIMETFPIVKRKDIKRTELKNDAGEVTQEGRYITKETILEIYDEMAEAIRTGQPYQTRLDPPPGPPTDTESNFIPMAQWDKSNWPSHIHPPREAVVDAPVIATPIVVDPAFPSSDLEKVLCACLLDFVQLQPNLNSDEYVDMTLLAMQTDRCSKLLTGNDRNDFRQSAQTALPELIADANGSPPWQPMLACLLANDSLTRTGTQLAVGANFDTVRTRFPDISESFIGLVAKASERLRELQDIVAPDDSEAGQAAQEIHDQHAAVVGA